MALRRGDFAHQRTTRRKRKLSFSFDRYVDLLKNKSTLTIRSLLHVQIRTLMAHLRASGRASVPISFDKIERIVGVKLPPSAFKYRAWWSNNPTNSVITHAWLDVGYKTANVDMAGRKLVFRKSSTKTSHGREAPNGADTSEATMPVISRLSRCAQGHGDDRAGRRLDFPRR